MHFGQQQWKISQLNGVHVQCHQCRFVLPTVNTFTSCPSVPHLPSNIMNKHQYVLATEKVGNSKLSPHKHGVLNTKGLKPSEM